MELLKKLTSSLCGFVLIGSFTPVHQDMANKYSPFFGPRVVINMTDKPGYNYGLSNCTRPLTERVLGCTYFDSSGKPYAIDILGDIGWIQFFENTLTHEICHLIIPGCTTNEQMAISYANQMTSWRNNLK